MGENQNSQLASIDAGYSELEESIRRLSLTAEDQFESIKHEKWYLRLWDIVTFSRKGEKRLAEQISTLAQAQQILAQYLLKASQQDKDISDLVNNNASYIEKLAGQSIRFKKELTSISNLMLLLNEINNGSIIFLVGLTLPHCRLSIPSASLDRNLRQCFSVVTPTATNSGTVCFLPVGPRHRSIA